MNEDKVQIRRLVPGEETMVDAFLAPHTASSMFLRSNMRRAGLGYNEQPFEGIYVGAFEGDNLRGVIAHYWNGNVMVQAYRDAIALIRAVLLQSDMPFKGLLGPWNQVASICHSFGITRDKTQTFGRELLFDLTLDRLQLPQALIDGAVSARRSQPGDFERLLEWRIQYDTEALNQPPTAENRADNERSLHNNHESGHQFILESNGTLVSSCTFNAVLDHYVQIGGVWTPPELRGRGYARAIVAGALRLAKAEGTSTAILFTEENNIAAQKPYRAIGFEQIGEFGLILFGQDARILIKELA